VWRMTWQAFSARPYRREDADPQALHALDGAGVVGRHAAAAAPRTPLHAHYPSGTALPRCHRPGVEPAVGGDVVGLAA
jgi:hypothetical protein